MENAAPVCAATCLSAKFRLVSFAPDLAAFLPDLLAYGIERFLNGLAALVAAPKPSVRHGQTEHHES
ncbi:MAG: hypothetical protein JOZ80_20560 [Acidobacteriaceae bacterium]|nr:hypothetical protein [Acidobacteriaceae bacterium]